MRRLWLSQLHGFHPSKEGVHVHLLLCLINGSIAEQGIEERITFIVIAEILLARDTEAVKATAQSDALKGLAVTTGKVHTLIDIVDRLVGSVLVSLINDGVSGRATHSLDGCQSETYLSLAVHTELQTTLVDIWSEGADAHGPALIHQLRHFRDILQVPTHHCGHILSRIVCLQIGRLIGYPRIAGGMTLIERIRGELLPVLPDLVQHLLVVPVLGTALIEQLLQLLHVGNLLLTHRLTQRVRLSSGEVGEKSGEKHHLLLIDGDTIGILEILLHAGQVVLDLRRISLSCDEVGDIVHRSRAIQRIHSDQVLKDRRLQFTEVFLHTCRFKLEGTHGTSLSV